MYFNPPPMATKLWRFKTVLAVLFLCACVLMGRILYLAVFNQSFLKTQGDIRALRMIAIPAYRGMITDRNGYPLAISTPVAAVWLDPETFDSQSIQLVSLAKLLNMPVADIVLRAQKNAHREFVYLKRGLDPATGRQIRELAIPGVSVQQEYKRFYPEGEVTAHLLGFTNIDDQGQEGLELAYNSWLAGSAGRKQVLKDRLGRVVADIQTVKAAEPGHNLVLSIDQRMQFLAYQALSDGVTKFKAVSGSAIVLDVKTGEILAMVNVPSYNPNNRPAGHSEVYRNRAVTDVYEPGSVMKTISMASALASGQFQADSKVDTSPGYMMLTGHRIEDEHNNGVIDMATLLAKSSNVGMTKITLALPPDRLWQTFHAFGFGQATASEFPGESSGVLRRQNPWRLFDLATMSFGYGMSATPLQVAQAYAVIGNDGVKLPLSLLHLDRAPAGQQILSSQVSRALLDLLEAVIYQQGGTAPLAKVPGYRVTGKTGTSRLLGPHGYLKHRYNSAFVGLAPAADPRVLVYVQIHDPQGSIYYGGFTAGPVFSKIMGNCLRLMNILPNDASSDTAPPSLSEAMAQAATINDF